MPLLRLTKTSVDRLEYSGKQVEYFDTKLTGFGVRVNQNSKSFFAQGKVVRPEGGRVKFNETIGRVGIVSFDDAWVAAKRILESAALGNTPSELQIERSRQAERGAKVDITLREVHGKYTKVKKKLKASTAKEYLDSLGRNVPDWLDKPIRSITSAMVIERHASIGKRSKAQADSTMRVVRALCQFVIDMYEELDIMSRNPVRRLSAANLWYRPGRKTSYIRPEYLPEWFAAVLRLDELNRMFFLLLLFTGARFTEAASVKVKNFNFRAGCAMFRQTKSGKPLEVPVSSYLLPRLEAYVYRNHLKPEDYMFPSPWRKRSAAGHMVDARHASGTVAELSGVQFTPHDLRRTFLSYSATLRIPKLMQKRLVGHAIPDDVTDGYIQIPFEDMQQAVEEISAYILKVAKQE